MQGLHYQQHILLCAPQLPATMLYNTKKSPPSSPFLPFVPLSQQINPVVRPTDHIIIIIVIQKHHRGNISISAPGEALPPWPENPTIPSSPGIPNATLQNKTSPKPEPLDQNPASYFTDLRTCSRRVGACASLPSFHMPMPSACPPGRPSESSSA